MLETNNQVNVPIKRRSYLKLILYIVISVIATAMIVCGPILMQQYNGEGSNPRNNFVCWIGAFMLSMPMVFLVIICITMVFKSFFKRK